MSATGFDGGGATEVLQAATRTAVSASAPARPGDIVMVVPLSELLFS
jgi:hypothetical protein